MKQRVYNSTFRDPGYPLFKPRDSGFSLFETRDSGLKVCTGGGMPKITRGITGLKNAIGPSEHTTSKYIDLAKRKILPLFSEY